MKLTKTEKIWIVVVAIFYILYNIPGVPPYGEAVPTIVHGLLTVLPLWVAVYIGLSRVYKIYKLRDDEEEETASETKED